MIDIFSAIRIFTSDWFTTRHYTSLLAGLPALLGVACVGLIVGTSAPKSVQLKRFDQYQRAGVGAMQVDDHARAKLWFERALQIRPDEPRVQLALAEATRQDGEPEVAIKILQDVIANADRGTAVEAALLAVEIRINALPDAENDEQRRAMLHSSEAFARIAFEKAPESRDAAGALAQILAQTGRVDGAIETLEPVATQHRDFYVTLAHLAAANQDQSSAKRYAENAVQFLKSQIAIDPENFNVRSALANMLQQAGEFTEATRLLNEGMRLANDDQKELLTEVYVRISLREFDRLSDETYSLQILRKQLALLDQMLKFRGNNLQVMARLARIVGAYEFLDDKYEVHLKQALTETPHPETIHLVLGTYYAKAEQFDEALFHLEAAYRSDLKSATLMNNLAWVIAAIQPQDVDRALTLVDAAIKMRPGDPDLISTHAEILFKLQRWDESRSDFESIIGRIENPKRVHERLAVIYDKLGKSDIAELHRSKSQ
ncbi:tetratricopeptide repeat protein [Rosistilla oblonga]|uniref:tetratricopeptide repeat protein n=1 Tax=Rosistilla oblonga TaxID=2527990 RepID=UPI003A97FDBB